MNRHIENATIDRLQFSPLVQISHSTLVELLQSFLWPSHWGPVMRTEPSLQTPQFSYPWFFKVFDLWHVLPYNLTMHNYLNLKKDNHWVMKIQWCIWNRAHGILTEFKAVILFTCSLVGVPACKGTSSSRSWKNIPGPAIFRRKGRWRTRIFKSSGSRLHPSQFSYLVALVQWLVYGQRGKKNEVQISTWAMFCSYIRPPV